MPKEKTQPEGAKVADGVDLAGKSFDEHHREVAIHQLSALTPASALEAVTKAIEDAVRAKLDPKQVEDILSARGFSREKLEQLHADAEEGDEDEQPQKDD